MRELLRRRRIRCRLIGKCSSRGEIAYSVGEARLSPRGVLPQTADTVIEIGPPGREQHANRHWQQGVRDMPVNIDFFGDYSSSGRRCDTFRGKPHAGLWAANYSRSAELDFGPYDFRSAAPYPVSIDLVSASRRAHLAIKPRADIPFAPFHVDTPAWDDSFLIWQDINSGERSSEYYPAFRISSTGNVSSLRIPNVPAVLGADIIPTKTGYVVSSTGAFSNNALVDGGIYLLRGEEISKTYSGSYTVATVSANGCLVAFYRLRSTGDPYSPLSNIVVLDFCSAGTGE